MPRWLGLLAFSLTAGCSWGWDSFELAGGGMDAALVDAGPDARDGGGSRDGGEVDAGSEGMDGGPAPIDGPPACEGPFYEVCPSGTLCTQPASDRLQPCCDVGGCVDRADRPIGWARNIGRDWGSLDGRDGEEHWRPPTTTYPLTSVRDTQVPMTADGRAEFSAVWSDIALILYVRGTDDVLYNSIDSPALELEDLDAVEVHIDVAPASPGPPDAVLDSDENHVGFLIRGGRMVTHLGHMNPSEWDNLTVATRADATGWGMEIVISWADIGRAVPTAGDVLGLDVVYRDADGSSVPLSHAQWSRCDRARHEVMGLLVLAAPSEVPVLSGCEQTCASTLCAPAGYACGHTVQCAP